DRKTLLRDLDTCGGPECIFKAVEIAETVLWRRLGPEERSERPAMHGAESRVIFDRENQRIDLRMPAHSILQVLSRSNHRRPRLTSKARVQGHASKNTRPRLTKPRGRA